MLIIVHYYWIFSQTKILMFSFVKAKGWVLVTRKMTKKGHKVREYVLSKEWLQKKKEFLDVNPRIQIDHRESCLTNVFHVLSMQKTNKSFRVCLTNFFHVLYMKKNFKRATWMLNLTNVGLSMCIKEYSDLFLNLMIEYAV